MVPGMFETSPRNALDGSQNAEISMHGHPDRLCLCMFPKQGDLEPHCVPVVSAVHVILLCKKQKAQP